MISKGPKYCAINFIRTPLVFVSMGGKFCELVKSLLKSTIGSNLGILGSIFLLYKR